MKKMIDLPFDNQGQQNIKFAVIIILRPGLLIEEANDEWLSE